MGERRKRQAQLYYLRLPDSWTRAEKLDFLREYNPEAVEWRRLRPNRHHTWLVSATEEEFESHIPIGSKEAKRTKTEKPETIFKTYSGGIKTHRDVYVYDYEYDSLAKRARQFIENYNAEVDRYQRQNPKPENVDDFVDYDKIKWGMSLKQHLKRGNYAKHSLDKIRTTLYRPFTKKYLFFDRILCEVVYQQPYFYPNEQAEVENQIIICSDVSYRANTFSALISDVIPDVHLCASVDSHQCFPFYVYDADGGNRKENITDWALARFRSHYKDESISKWDIFYYVYGILHHPGYRSRYAIDLKRQLPRIPFARRFRAFSQAGKTLAGLHLDYETSERYELDWQASQKSISYRVDKMLPQNKRKSKVGYTVYDRLKVNGSLTLRGIPERAFAYRLGNRSALDWIVDQYRVKTDKRSGIVHNPNGWSDDERYIVNLVERVIGVSLRTVEILDELAKIPFGA